MIRFLYFDNDTELKIHMLLIIISDIHTLEYFEILISKMVTSRMKIYLKN